jgi:hypothetical protein
MENEKRKIMIFGGTGYIGMAWREYLRVKIQMDITKPLPRGRKLNIEGKIVWVTFKYERLPKFCFHCGVLNHGKTGCAKKSELRHLKANPQYGPWLRAASPTRIADRNKQAQKRGQAQPEWNTTGERGRRNGQRPTREDDRRRGDTDFTDVGDSFPASKSRDHHWAKFSRSPTRKESEVYGEIFGDSRDFSQRGKYRSPNREVTAGSRGMAGKDFVGATKGEVTADSENQSRDFRSPQQERKLEENNDEMEDNWKTGKSKEKADGGFGAPRTATQDTGETKMGYSPSPGGAVYSGPLLSNVAKTIKAVQDAKGPIFVEEKADKRRAQAGK